MVKVDVDRAIAYYTRATELYPYEHRIFWKLAAAYEKKEEWARMSEVLTRAVELGPHFANYWYRLGLARVNLAEAGDPSAYERAKEPLRRCIATDANIAECHYLLGEALEFADDPQSALVEYSKAILLDPERGFFYPPLARLYLTLGLPKQAAEVLQEGLRLVADNDKNGAALFTMDTLLASLAAVRRNEPERIRWLVEAERHLRYVDPEHVFALGAAYTGTTPPQKERARRLLGWFIERQCHGTAALVYKTECESSPRLLENVAGAP